MNRTEKPCIDCVEGQATEKTGEPLSAPHSASDAEERIQGDEPLDREQLATLRHDAGASLFEELLERFLSGLPQRLTEIREAVGSGSSERLRFASHLLRGSCGTFGAVRLTRVCVRLERLARNPVDEEASSALLDLEAEAARLADVLAKERANREPVAEAARDKLAAERAGAALKCSAIGRTGAFAIPEDIFHAFGGKRFGLVGFGREAAQSIMVTLDEVGAFTTEITASSAEEWNEGVRQFDVLLVHISTQPDKFPPFRCGISIAKPVLLLGSRDELLAHNGALARPDRDFLIEPWCPEDLLLRSWRLLSIEQPGGESAMSFADRHAAANVLVADDDSTVATMVAAVLKSSGLECRIAHDGVEALEMARELAHGALVLDLNMPRMSGMEVLASLRNDRATSRIPVLILTTFHDEADVVRGFSLGANDYVTKPFSPVELVARVRRLLSAAS